MSTLHVIVTGGTGWAGREAARELVLRGHHVIILSRGRRAPGHGLADVEQRTADVVTGAGFPAALEGADTVVHAAAPRGLKLGTLAVQGTRTVLHAAREVGVAHMVHVSIVGIDHVPGYPYYAAKREEEALLAGSGLAWSVVRATQFHPFLALGFRLGAPVAVPYATRTPVQPIHPRDVGRALAAAVDDGASGAIRNVAGPQVLSFRKVARTWRHANDLRRPLLGIHVPGGLGRALRQGRLTDPDAAVDGETFAEWATRSR